MAWQHIEWCFTVYTSIQVWMSLTIRLLCTLACDYRFDGSWPMGAAIVTLFSLLGGQAAPLH